jgi:formate hydrogenlyase subunit 4
MLGVLAWVVKLAALCLVLAAFESAIAKMRVFRVPEFLGIALLLGILGAVLLFVSARLA